MLIKYFGTTNCEIDKEYRKHKMVTFSAHFSCWKAVFLLVYSSFADLFGLLFLFICFFYFKAKKFLLTSRKLVEVNYTL